MPFDPQISHRRSIRIPGYDYSQPGAYFVTVVTAHRENLFGEVLNGGMCLSEYGWIADECWRLIPAHFPNVELGLFVIMPNHVHGIILLHDHGSAMTSADAFVSAGRGTPSSSMDDRSARVSPTVVGAQHVAPLRGEQMPHVVPGSLGAIIRAYKASVMRIIRHKYADPPQRIWQRNYYEHILRNEKDYQRITAYILTNPLHWEQDEENIP